METGKLLGQLMRYGLGENEARLYVFLLKMGKDMSVLELARGLKWGRTPVYSAVERLLAKGLVGQVMADNGQRYEALSPDNLEKYWEREMDKTRSKAEKLPEVVNLLEGLAMSTGYRSKVDYFTGKRGLEQITYNSLRADGDMYIYEVGTDMGKFVDFGTAERFREKMVDKRIVTHQLTNHENFENWTEVEGMAEEFWDIRYVAPEVLEIKFEMLIYNDVVAMYSVEGGELMGVEIRNLNLAKMQKQIFEVVARQGKPLVKKGKWGAAKLE